LDLAVSPPAKDHELTDENVGIANVSFIAFRCVGNEKHSSFGVDLLEVPRNKEWGPGKIA
jgi:hypothetical protein